MSSRREFLKQAAAAGVSGAAMLPALGCAAPRAATTAPMRRWRARWPSSPAGRAASDSASRGPFRPGLEQAAAEAIRVFGKVHVLVNNAGVMIPPTLTTTTYEDWDWVLNVNLTGVFNGVRAFLPHLQAHGEGGQMITTASPAGLFVVVPVHGAYTVSKVAVVGLMEQLRTELADTNIGVSVFCPGPAGSHHLGDSIRNRPRDLSKPSLNQHPKPKASAEQKDVMKLGSLDWR